MLYYFYKICCRNLNIQDVYVGCTRNFNVRKHQHKVNCTSQKSKAYHYYVYRFIREHDGFDNWDIIEIERKECIDKIDARKNERKIIEELNATLNKNLPTRTIEEYRKTYDKEIKEQVKEYKKTYNEENKELIKQHKKEHYMKNKEEINIKKKEHYEKNKDKILSQQKQNYDKEKRKLYIEENKDRIQQNKEKYRKENSDVIGEYNKQYYNKTKKTYFCEICNKELVVRRNNVHEETRKHIEKLKERLQ